MTIMIIMIKVISDSDSDFEYSPRTARNLKKATTILSKLKVTIIFCGKLAMCLHIMHSHY